MSCTETVSLSGSVVMESIAEGGKRFVVYVDDDSPIEVGRDYVDLLHTVYPPDSCPQEDK